MPEDEVKTPGYASFWSDGWEAQYNASVWGASESGIYPGTVEQDADSKPEMPNTIAGAKFHETAEHSSIPQQPKEYYANGEILAALHDLSEKEIKQMQSLARFRLIGKAGGPGHVEVEDLFSDAALRTMEQKRSWQRGVSPRNHFFAVMRSISHQRLKQAARYVPLSELVAAPQDWSLSALDAKASVARLKEQLRGDAIALNVLESMMDEMRPRDTQRSLGIRAEVYWAARKRIRRQAENLPGAPVSSGARPPKRPSSKRARLSMSMNRMG